MWQIVAANLKKLRLYDLESAQWDFSTIVQKVYVAISY